MHKSKSRKKAIASLDKNEDNKEDNKVLKKKEKSVKSLEAKMNEKE